MSEEQAPHQAPAQSAKPDVAVIMVNYNTRDLTLKAIETLLANAGDIAIEVIVWDNASSDGSAEAIATRFPQVRLLRSEDNLGFGKANNAAAEQVVAEWILLLNSDTETHSGAVEKAVRFAEQHPEAGIIGGRAVFPDGSLNPTSCFSRISLWGLFCTAVGLHLVFPDSTVFNREMIGGWQRDHARHVDIVSGSFMLMRTALWRELGGFNPRYFMYAEDLDICMRAERLGYRPMITPEARIMHLGGASAIRREEKMVQMMQGRASLVRDHWSAVKAPLGIAMLQLFVLVRLAGGLLGKAMGRSSDNLQTYRGAWRRRHDWRKGY